MVASWWRGGGVVVSWWRGGGVVTLGAWMMSVKVFRVERTLMVEDDAECVR